MQTDTELQASVTSPSRLEIELGIGEYVIGSYGSKDGRSYLVIERNSHGKQTGERFEEGPIDSFPPDCVVISSNRLAAWGVLHKVLTHVIETDAVRLALQEVESAEG